MGNPTNSTGHFAVEASAWIACVLASSLAIFLLVKFGVAVEFFSLAVAVLTMALLCICHLVYRRWRPDPMLANLCGALAVILWSAGTAGIISLAGLRYGAPLIDGKLAAIDLALHMDPQFFVHLVSGSPWAVLLGVAYDSSFVLLFALTIFLTLTRRFEQLWQLAFVFAVTIFACTTISVLFPARGAFAHFDYSGDVLSRLPTGAGLYHLPKFDYYRYDPSPIVSFSSLQGVVTFPSFHCCLALATLFACYGVRWLFAASLVWNGLVIVSTVPIGGHYAIDIPGGAALWLVATATSWALSRSRNATRADAKPAVRFEPDDAVVKEPLGV